MFVFPYSLYFSLADAITVYYSTLWGLLRALHSSILSRQHTVACALMKMVLQEVISRADLRHALPRSPAALVSRMSVICYTAPRWPVVPSGPN